MAQKKLHITAHNQHGLIHNSQANRPEIERWLKKLDDSKVWRVQVIDEKGEEIGGKKPGRKRSFGAPLIRDHKLAAQADQEAKTEAICPCS